MASKSFVASELRKDIYKKRMGKMTQEAFNQRWYRVFAGYPFVELFGRVASKSGNYSVVWHKNYDKRVTPGKKEVRGEKEFANLQEAIQFSKKKAISFGQYAGFRTSGLPKKYDGLWIALDGKMLKVN